MKKTSFFFLLIASFVLISGCSANLDNAPTSDNTPLPDNSPSASATPPSEAPAQESTAVDSDNPLLLANFSTDTVRSGSGKDIGTYGYIEVARSSLPSLFTDEFFDYFTEFADARVQDSGFNWVSIILDDGTGFCFTGSNVIFVDYGDIDGEGCVTTMRGICRRLTDAGGYKCIRYIPNPTILQEALAPDNEFNPIEEIIFNTPASENGLGDSTFYAEGKIVSRFEMSGYDTIQFSTDLGDIYISAALVPMVISEGEANTVYFVYTGLSDEYNCPCGVYVHHE